MDLESLSSFNLVAQHGGFGRASRASARSKATLSRHVAALEAALGVRLIERGGRTLHLTEEGQALHERTTTLLGELQDAADAVTSGAALPRGRLRVSAPIVIAHVALARIAARFAATCPDVQLELVADDRIVDPVEEGFDIVVRIDPKADERLFGRRILGDERVVVAAIAPPKGALVRRDRADPAFPAVVLTKLASDARWPIRTPRNASVVIQPQPLLRLSSLLMVREAVLAGVGIALLPRLLVADDLAAGRLVLWGVEDAKPVEIWAMQTAHRHISAKVRAFLDALTAAFPDKVFR